MDKWASKRSPRFGMNRKNSRYYPGTRMILETFQVTEKVWLLGSGGACIKLT